MALANTLAIPPAPMFARAGDGDCYYWDGTPLPRVTSTIDMFTGGHLPMWYAEMTAKECAALAQQYDDGHLEIEHLLSDLKDVRARSTAAIRYRDEKGAVGSIMHHAQDERLVKGLQVSSDDMLDYLHGVALTLHKSDPEKDKPGMEPYALTLARKAKPYVLHLFDFFDRAEMRIEAAEMVAVSLSHGYAGTLDVCAYAETKWLRKLLGKDFPESWGDYSEVAMIGDYKSSNQLNVDKIRMQVEPYARADFWGIPSPDGATGQRFDVPATQGRFALHIKPVDGAKMVAWESDGDSWEAFLNLHDVRYHLKGEPKPKRVKATIQKTKGRKECPI